MLLAALVLMAAAWMRGAEYDEQYTLFLTAGAARPDWPEDVFPAGRVAAAQAGHASPGGLVRDLRATDVHPPLYFLGVLAWRLVFGSGLFAVRMLSVLCGLASLWLVGTIARRCAIRPALAMALTLGCYGFVYTNAIARGFAPAEMLLLASVLSLLEHRRLLAGLFLGAACCCNYLAAFIAAAVVVASGEWLAIVTALPFLTVDAWFFAAQHAARSGQFPPFDVGTSLVRVAKYQTASVFGGLPLYVDGLARSLAGVFVGGLTIALMIAVARSRPLSSGRAIRMLLAAAVATPVGLMLLGAVFDTTPIELRYLSFGLPFLAMPGARALFASTALSGRSWDSRRTWCVFPLRLFQYGSVPRNELLWCAKARHPRFGLSRASKDVDGAPSRTMTRTVIAAANAKMRTVFARSDRWRTLTICLILITQAAGIAGLLLSPRTMQPARAVATEAAGLAEDGVILLPRGNDGVGIVGAFGIEAPAWLPLLLVRPGDSFLSKIIGVDRVILAPIVQDHDSAEAVAAMRAAFASPNWRRVANGSNVEIYERTGQRE